MRLKENCYMRQGKKTMNTHNVFLVWGIFKMQLILKGQKACILKERQYCPKGERLDLRK